MSKQHSRHTNIVGRYYQRVKDNSDLARKGYEKQGELKISLPNGEVKYFKNSYQYRQWKNSQGKNTTNSPDQYHQYK